MPTKRAMASEITRWMQHAKRTNRPNPNGKRIWLPSMYSSYNERARLQAVPAKTMHTMT